MEYLSQLKKYYSSIKKKYKKDINELEEIIENKDINKKDRGLYKDILKHTKERYNKIDSNFLFLKKLYQQSDNLDVSLKNTTVNWIESFKKDYKKLTEKAEKTKKRIGNLF